MSTKIEAFQCGRLNETNLARQVIRLNAFMAKVDVTNVITTQDGESGAIVFVIYTEKQQTKTPSKTTAKAE